MLTKLKDFFKPLEFGRVDDYDCGWEVTLVNGRVYPNDKDLITIEWK